MIKSFKDLLIQHMLFHEQNTYILHISDKYEDMFLQFICDRV